MTDSEILQGGQMLEQSFSLAKPWWTLHNDMKLHPLETSQFLVIQTSAGRSHAGDHLVLDSGIVQVLSLLPFCPDSPILPMDLFSLL